MKAGQKLEYIGKGFIGFHPHHREMLFLEKEGENDYWVDYKGGTINGKMLVRKSEVKEP